MLVLEELLILVHVLVSVLRSLHAAHMDDGAVIHSADFILDTRGARVLGVGRPVLEWRLQETHITDFNVHIRLG
jgi:hypothetical protein